MEHTCHISFQLIPLTEANKTYSTIELALDIIKKSGLKHITGPMETTLEGNYNEIMEVIYRAQQVTLDASGEVVSIIKVHLRKDGKVSFEEKGI